MDNYKNNIFYTGVFSGIIQTIVGHPFDTYKVHKQHNKPFSNKIMFRGMSLPLLTNSIVSGTQFYSFQNYPMFLGLISSLMITPIEYYKIQKQIHGHYPYKFPNGFRVTYMRETFALHLYFNSYNYLEPNLGSFMAGGFAGSLSWLFSYPFDTIKTRVQSDLPLKQAILHKNFFKGLQITLVRGFIVNGCGFFGANLISNYI